MIDGVPSLAPSDAEEVLIGPTNEVDEVDNDATIELVKFSAPVVLGLMTRVSTSATGTGLAEVGRHSQESTPIVTNCPRISLEHRRKNQQNLVNERLQPLPWILQKEDLVAESLLR